MQLFGDQVPVITFMGVGGGGGVGGGMKTGEETGCTGGEKYK